MKVVLTKNVPHLGMVGDVKEVKRGYGFNFLLSQGLAELATPEAIKNLSHQIVKRKAEREENVAFLAGILKKIDGTTLSIRAKARSGKLFGSVGPAEIVKAAQQHDIEIPQTLVVMERPIRTIGEHAVTLRSGTTQVVVNVSVVAE